MVGRIIEKIMDSIVKGSVTDVAKTKGMEIAEAIMDVDSIVFIDTSGSMEIVDPGQDASRHELARQQLVEIQSNNPGKVGLCSFSNTVQFCPDGIPKIEGGGTNMNAALKWGLQLNGMGVSLIVVSDGLPNRKLLSLQTAAQIDNIIHTVYIGPESDTEAIQFMRDLANAGRGKALTTKEVPQLAEKVQFLLTG